MNMNKKSFCLQPREARYEAPRMSGPFEVRRSFMTGSNTGMTIPEITEENLDW